MATTAEQTSPHLASARLLLEKLRPELDDEQSDAQTKATAAAAHAILVLAEQVAATRIVMASDVLAQRAERQ